MIIEREINQEFEQLDRTHQIVGIVGPRQAGKTTFLREQAGKGKNIIYVSLDDIDAKYLFDNDIKKFEMNYLEKSKPCIIDEVQYGKDAGLKLKNLADRGYKLWITSSSQTLLEAEVISYLAGRIGTLCLLNFSFAEMLKAKGQKAYSDKILERIIWEHATFGGYPKVVLTENVGDKTAILKNLFSTVLLKDIFQTFKIDDHETLYRLSSFLANYVGNELSYDSVSKKLGISIPTLHKYIDALEKNYLVKRVYPFFTNKSLEIVKQPKIYFYDCGMRNAVINVFPQDLESAGKVFENYVLTELLKQDLKINYWKSKNKAEVDFVVTKNNKIIPIEVKLNAGPEIEKSMRSFIDAYNPTEAFIVTYRGSTGEQKINGCKIMTVKLDKLLERLAISK